VPFFSLGPAILPRDIFFSVSANDDPPGGTFLKSKIPTPSQFFVQDRRVFILVRQFIIRPSLWLCGLILPEPPRGFAGPRLSKPANGLSAKMLCRARQDARTKQERAHPYISEQDAFEQVSWQAAAAGYPFAVHLCPSYGSAIGSPATAPTALAD